MEDLPVYSKNKKKKETESVKEEIEETVEQEESTEKEYGDDIGSELLSCLFNKRTQFHIWHLQTESFAQHKLFQELYEGVLDLADSILEQYQGKYGRVYGYKSCECEDYCNCEKATKYLEGFCYEVKHWKKQLDTDSNLNNLFDELLGLFL